MAAEERFDLFAACAPGLEPFVLSELVDLGLRSSTNPAVTVSGQGGISFRGALADLYRVNLHLRTATRVLLRLGEFHALSFAELRQKAAQLPWERFLRPGQPLNIQATCKQSRLYHSTAVSQRVAEGIADCLFKSPPKGKAAGSRVPTQRVVVRLFRDTCTISLDSSGEPLYKRGYRQALAKAPLRETLAAGMLMASGWDRQSPLIDPFCGSGTIPIEAALMASSIPPGMWRKYAFMNWSGFDPRIWEGMLKSAQDGINPSSAFIYASDRDAGAVKIAEENARRAGVVGCIAFHQHAFSALPSPAGTGWLVTNPPYGQRASPNHDLRDLFAAFGALLQRAFRGWRVAFLCPDDRLATLTRLKFEKGISLDNGGIPVKLNLGTVP